MGSCEIALRYDAVLTDCNGNNIEDGCDIAAGAPDQDHDGRLDACELARGDLDLNGEVNSVDLASLLSLWGTLNPPFGDLNDDGAIGSQDLGILLSNWGPY